MQDILASLNPEQKQATTHTYGPLMVLAGPGTGKTQILTARIAYLLGSDIGIAPDNILCLTFTESGASSMKDRLATMIGTDSYKVNISTFHGFCEMVLTEYSHYFTDLKKNRILGEDIDKALVLRKSLEKLKDLQYFKPYWDEFFYQKSLLGSISQLKRENVTPQALEDLIPQEEQRLLEDPQNFYLKDYKTFKKGDFKPTRKKQIEEKVSKMRELSRIWKEYEQDLDQAGFYDFDDQINWVVEKMCKSEDLRADLQERFQWILVDEYQDTNNAQNEILWNLCAEVESPNLFVVGDDDQSIYRFQGASLENMLEFKDKFPTSNTITLKSNYRSTQNILDTAFGVIGHNPNRLDPEKTLTSQKNLETQTQVQEILHPSPLAEVENIADMIKGLGTRSDAISYSDIAILTRTNGELSYFLHHLTSLGIPVEAHINEDLLAHPLVEALILMIKVLSDLSNDHDLIKLLHSPFLDISAADLMKLSLHRNQTKENLLTLLEQNKTPNLKDQESLTKFYEFFVTSRKDYFHLRPAVLAEKLLYESGLAQYLNTKAKSDWHYLKSFIDWIRNQNIQTPSSLIEKIELHQVLNITVTPPPMVSGQKAVQLMTAHRSKGLEFDQVFIVGLWDKKWGNNKGRSLIPIPQITKTKASDNEDERRLFFVALTRAKSQLYLSRSLEDFNGREKTPSLFLHEIPNELKNLETKERTNECLSPQVLKSSSFSDDNIKNLLEKRVSNFVWSASSLQSYLDHPRRFLYQNLLKYPRRPLPHLALGVCLHQALELYLRESDLSPDLKRLLAHFEYALSGQNLTKNKYEELLNYGTKLLENYYDQKLTFPQNQDQHLEFDFHRFTPILNDIRITGKVDKLIYLDEKQKTAKIVDYKSGKPKSIRHGESLWRQLVFYDLLARSSQGFQTTIIQTELEFLTPGKTDDIETKVYEVTSEDRATVTQELVWANAQIQALNFPPVENPENKADIDFWNTFGLD